MGARITQRDIVAGLRNLKRASRSYVNASNTNPETAYDGDLHDAALAYARLVQKVARAGRS